LNVTLLRSLLFVPGNDKAKIRKASEVGADAIIVDLEDAVPANKKDEARRIVAGLLPELKESKTNVYVRVNRVGDPNLIRDLSEVVPASPHGIMLPKVNSPQDIRLLSRSLSALEKRYKLTLGSTKILALIETPLGVLNAFSIAGASRRLVGLSFGAIDFARTTGIHLTEEGYELLYARSHLVLAAHARGLAAIDTVHPNYKDLSALRREAEVARRLGFDGKLVVHPDQVGVVNSVFSPSEDDVRWALETVAAYELALKKGQGVATLRGRLIDLADYQHAKKTLAIAALTRSPSGLREQECKGSDRLSELQLFLAKLRDTY